MDKVDNTLSTNELKFVSNYFYEKYVECRKINHKINLYQNRDICMFIHNEHIKYNNAHKNKILGLSIN